MFLMLWCWNCVLSVRKRLLISVMMMLSGVFEGRVLVRLIIRRLKGIC